MSLISPEEGWAKLVAGLRRAEAAVLDGGAPNEVFSTDEYTTTTTTVYLMCTQKPPNNWSEDVYNRWRIEAQQFSARAVARLAGKQGDEYVAALFVVWRGFELYARFASGVFKYLDRFYVKRLDLPEIRKVVSQAFSGALEIEATTLGTGAEDRGRDIALLRGMQGRTSMPLAEETWRSLPRRVGPHEEKWQACLRLQSAVARRRRALALMYVLCAKEPPRAELGDDPGRLSVVVRLARDGPFEHDGRSPFVPLILSGAPCRRAN